MKCSSLWIALATSTFATFASHAAVTINANFAAGGGLDSGNYVAEQLPNAVGTASSCAAPKTAPTNFSANNVATSQHFLVNNGPARCVTVTVTRSANSVSTSDEPILVSFYSRDGSNPTSLGTREAFLGDTGSGSGNATASFVVPAFAIVAALVQRKTTNDLGARTITYQLTSSDLSPSSTGAQSISSADPSIFGRLNRNSVLINDTECREGSNKPHPLVEDIGTEYLYQDFTFYNQGPARCVYVGAINTSNCPLFLQAYKDAAPTGTLTTSSNYLGDAGGAGVYRVMKFWAPDNSRIIVRAQRVSTPACTLTFTMTAPGLSSTSPVVPSCTVDIDGNGTFSPATDGLMLSRVLAGVRGPEVLTNALGSGATRNTWPEVRDFLRDACGVPLPVE
jgi:hypothetical protein